MTSNEQIYERLGNIETKVEMTLAQALKTNGRVTKLEDHIAGLDVQMATKEGKLMGMKISKDFLITLIGLIIAAIGLYIRFK